MEQNIIVTVDVVLLTLRDDRLHVALHRRDKEPYNGQLALPGGYIHDNEDFDAEGSARRMLLDKTGIRAPYLEQLETFANSARDPRGWSVSVAYYALVAPESLSTGQLDLLPVDGLPVLAFDHNKLVAAAVQRVRNKAAYSSLACYLLPERFTLTELQRTYEKILGARLDKSSFRRKIASLDFLETIKDEVQAGRQRPAQFWKLKRESLTIFDKLLSQSN